MDTYRTVSRAGARRGSAFSLPERHGGRVAPRCTRWGSWMLGIEASLCGSRCSARATPGASLLWNGRVGPRALGRVLFPAAARVRAVGQLPRQRRSSRRPRRALLAQRLWPQPCCPCRREAIQRAMAGSVPGRWVGVGCSCLTARAPATTAPLDVTFWSSTASPRDY